MNTDKAILTCALTGVLTDPKQHPVPVTPAQMASEARDAFNAGLKNLRANGTYDTLVKQYLGPQP